MSTATSAMRENRVVFSAHGTSLHVDETVLRVWNSERQLDEDSHESFGVLIGSCSTWSDSCQVESVTTPYPGDSSSRFGFLLKDLNHQCDVDQAFEHSGGCLAYLGTWHTHPEPIPSPSGVDVKDWRVCINRNPDRKLFFVIVGTDQVRVFVPDGRGFSQLSIHGAKAP